MAAWEARRPGTIPIATGLRRRRHWCVRVKRGEEKGEGDLLGQVPGPWSLVPGPWFLVPFPTVTVTVTVTVPCLNTSQVSNGGLPPSGQLMSDWEWELHRQLLHHCLS
jgi:hypothetical protein